METFGERLYKLRERAGITRIQLARLMDTSENTIEAFETNYIDPPVHVLNRASQIFGVDEGYMACLSDDVKAEEDPSVKEIYVVHSLDGGNGIPKLSNVIGTVYLNRKDMRGGDYYAMPAKDDSMIKARIQKGDLMVIKRQPYANNGDIVVAVTENGTEIVRRYRREGNIVFLTSESNLPGFDAIKVDTTESTLVISGIVCEVRLNF